MSRWITVGGSSPSGSVHLMVVTEPVLQPMKKTRSAAATVSLAYSR